MSNENTKFINNLNILELGIKMKEQPDKYFIKLSINKDGEWNAKLEGIGAITDGLDIVDVVGGLFVMASDYIEIAKEDGLKW